MVLFRIRERGQTLEEIFKEIAKRTDLLLQDMADFCLFKAFENIDRMNLNYKYDLRKSGHVEKPEELKRWVVFDAKHAVYVEFGAKPHTPPVDAIQEWVENPRKLGIPPPQSREVAWKIVNTISKRGVHNYTDGKSDNSGMSFLRGAIVSLLQNIIMEALIDKYFPR